MTKVLVPSVRSLNWLDDQNPYRPKRPGTGRFIAQNISRPLYAVVHGPSLQA